MLDVFRRRVDALSEPELLLADAREPWPLADGTVDVVFGSRSWHWLDPEHAVRQSRRVAARTGALLLIGRLERERDSLRRRIRAQLHALMEGHGEPPRRGEQHARLLMEACVQAGGRALPRRVVAEWSVAVSPASVLDSWRQKEGLGGRSVSATDKASILLRLEEWTAEQFGNIEATVESNERFTLEGAALETSVSK
jgi:hypothetical protein